MATIITDDNVNLYMEVHGDGIPVIFSCAYCTTHENWRTQVNPLTRSGFRVILWDYRGHGKSGCPENPEQYTMERVVDDIYKVLEYGSNGKPAVLLGHSLGGLASFHFTLKYPQMVRALVLVGSGPGFKNPESAEKWMKQIERTAVFLEEKGFEPLIDKAASTIIGRYPELPAARAAKKVIIAQDPYAVAQFGRRIAGPAPSVIDELKKITCPALVAVGREDIPYIKAAEVMTVLLPNSRKQILEDVGHIMNIEDPDAFNNMLIDYLKSLS